MCIMAVRQSFVLCVYCNIVGVLQGLHLLFPYVTKRIVDVGSVDDIVTLLSSDYPYIQRMSKVTQEQLNSFGNCSQLTDLQQA